jgi:hypothetical protein
VYITVLGIAQDAGYPQASCYQPHCIRAWENKDLKRLTSSIAVVDEESKAKYLFDATPDIREQLYQLHRAAPDNEFALRGVFLTHGLDALWARGHGSSRRTCVRNATHARVSVIERAVGSIGAIPEHKTHADRI